MMNNPIPPMNNAAKPDNDDKQRVTKPDVGDKQRGVGVVELLFAASTLGAAVVTAALLSPKRPESG
jgi:hypothetical protein